MFKQYRLRDYRFRLVAYVFILCIIGILVVGSARADLQSRQVMGVCLGLVMMAVFSVIDYKYILRFWPFIYLLIVAMLAAVLLIGDDSHGATRWISIGGFQFQPSELCKILIICFFAAFFTRFQDSLNTLKILGISIVLIGIPLFLIFSQPNLSTTIIVTLIFITLLFIAGLSYKIVLTVLAAAVPLSIVGIILLVNRVLPLQDYQYNRILSFIDPEKYSDGFWQQRNSIMAIGSGQIWGKGLNTDSINSVKNGNFLSESQTDFIFAIVGEELGFVGCVIVIGLLFLIVVECIIIARRAQGMAGRLICCGVAAWIGFQSFVNICVATGMMPNTGVPLPFVSYGLTSIVSLFIGIGIVLNVGLQPRKYGSGDSI